LVSSIQCQEATKLIVGYQSYLKNGIWPKETGEPLKGALMIDLQYNRYSVMEIKRNKSCVVCGENGLAEKPVPVLMIPIGDIHDSTSRLHQIVASRMKLTGPKIMLFLQRQNKTVRVERAQSLRRLRIGAGSVMTAVAQDGPDYSEAVVRLTRP
jgi:hypothetical protein